MAHRRQHYLPQFLLRRFAVRSGRWEGHTWRLDTSTGTTRAVVPKTEAAEPFYYQLPDEVLDGVEQPEQLLGKIESGFSAAIHRLEAQTPLSDDAFHYLALFACLQSRRTPREREQLRFMDELFARELNEMKLGDQEHTVEWLMRQDPTLSPDAAEARRVELLEQLRSGEIVLKSTPEREVALMFVGLEGAVQTILAQCNFMFHHFSGRVPLVLPDVGISRYDPTPSNPVGGIGFLSSPNVETVIAVSPEAALVIKPGEGNRIGHFEGSDEYAEELNLRAYASSESRIYGASQQHVVGVHRLAKRMPHLVIKRRPRPPVMWFTEDDVDSGEPVTFKGHSTAGVRTAEFLVGPNAKTGSVLKASDLWQED